MKIIKNAKEYKQSKNGTDIFMSKAFRDWIMETHLINDSIFDKQTKIYLLFRYNKDVFTKLFGKYHFRYKGEFHYYCWSFDLGKCNLIIFTAPIKGTCYEIIKEKNRKIDECAKEVIKFIEEKIFKEIVNNLSLKKRFIN